MARVKKQHKPAKPNVQHADAFQLRKRQTPTPEAESRVHVLGPGIICDTEPRGYETPRGESLTEILVDASEGFIPLWTRNTSLRWRFRERSLNDFSDPVAAKAEIRDLFADALLKWGAAAPVKFTEDDDVWDFEIVMRPGDQCSPSGCGLASAFFPDAGRHRLVVYPKMFTQSREERVDTLIHEVGHIFGLRHFFAKISETRWASEIFGTHSKFSIMNYGELSKLTSADRDDLSRLYQMAWSGALTQINGTPIRLVKPFSTLASVPEMMIAASQLQPVLQPQSSVAYIPGM